MKVISFGQYSGWDNADRKLPGLIELTDKVAGKIDVEFGMIVEIRHAKGRYIGYVVDHPPFRENDGSPAPPFTGEYQIRTNPARFFLGDTIRPPVEEKKGIWDLKILYLEMVLASKKIEII